MSAAGGSKRISRSYTIRAVKQRIVSVLVIRRNRRGCWGHRLLFLQIDIKKSKIPERTESDLEEVEQIQPIPTRITKNFPYC
jgi:hypothetical protein